MSKYPVRPFKKLASQVLTGRIVYGPITDEDMSNASKTLRGYHGNMMRPLASRILLHAKDCKQAGVSIPSDSPGGQLVRLAAQTLRPE